MGKWGMSWHDQERLKTLEIDQARELRERWRRRGRSGDKWHSYDIAARWVRRYCGKGESRIALSGSTADELREMARRLLEIADRLDEQSK